MSRVFAHHEAVLLHGPRERIRGRLKVFWSAQLRCKYFCRPSPSAVRRSFCVQSIQYPMMICPSL